MRKPSNRRIIYVLVLCSILFFSVPQAHGNTVVARAAYWAATRITRVVASIGVRQGLKTLWKWFWCRDCRADSPTATCVHCGGTNTHAIYSEVAPAPLPNGPNLGVLLDEWLVVNGVVRGSLADHLGVQAGDQIESINGYPVTSVAAISHLLNFVIDSNGGRTNLTVRRRLPLSTFNGTQTLTRSITLTGRILP